MQGNVKKEQVVRIFNSSGLVKAWLKKPNERTGNANESPNIFMSLMHPL